MKFLLDAQLSPAIAAWINREYSRHTASSVKAHGLRDATDLEVFDKALELGAVLITKDSDFVQRVQQSSTPPQIVWVTCGNTSNERMRNVLMDNLDTIVEMLERGEVVVELTDDR